MVVAATALTGCEFPESAAETSTITVWDYYGSATPIQPAIDAFEKVHPEITVNRVDREYDTVKTDFGGAKGPDVATLDLTWLPELADRGQLTDLGQLSSNRINGERFEHVYPSIAIDAMTYENEYVAAPLDFDTYALYYRSDLLTAAGLPEPKTWDDLRTAAKVLTSDADRNGRKGKARMQIGPDTFHFAQLLFQDGGAFLDTSGRRATFDQPVGVQALTAYRDLLRDGGIYWGPEQSDSSGLDGIRDGRIAMFINGPFMMGVLKDGVPEQAGKWRVARVPALGTNTRDRAGYLGGTGLGIPANTKNKQAAWKFIQFMLRIEQQRGVTEHAGAAPTTNQAILQLELVDPDPFFGGQQPNLVYLDALAAARPMPRVREWGQMDAVINTAVETALQGKKSPEQALDDAAKQVNQILAG
jgi:multiple sugar transport system substrate-binding protein